MSLYHYITVALITAPVSAQPSICFLSKIGFNSSINGLYEETGSNHNDQPILKSFHSGCNTTYLYWDTLFISNEDSGSPGWHIHTNEPAYSTETEPIAYCTQSTDYQTCSKWIVKKGSNYVQDPNVTIHSDPCPVPVSSIVNCTETNEHDNVLVIEMILLIIVLSATLLLLIVFGFRYFAKIRLKKGDESTVSDLVIHNQNQRQSDAQKPLELRMENQAAVASNSSIMVSPTNIPTLSSNQTYVSDTEIIFESDNVQKYSSKTLSNRTNQTDVLVIRIWLSEVGFPEYYDCFVANGYDSMDVIMAIENKNDLEEVGITLKGHQTKLLFEIRKLQRKQTIEETNNVTNIKSKEIIRVEESEEKKMNDAQSDCSDTDSNKYDNGYPIRATMSSYGSDNNNTINVTVGTYDEKNNGFLNGTQTESENVKVYAAYPNGKQYETSNATKKDKAYPVSVNTNNGNDYTNKRDGFVNNNVTKSGKVYPETLNETKKDKGNEYDKAYPMNSMPTNKGNGNANTVTTNGKAYPMNMHTNTYPTNGNVTRNGKAYPMGTVTVSKGKQYEISHETKTDKAYPISVYTSKGNENENSNVTKNGNAYPIGTFTDKGIINNNNNVTKKGMAYPTAVSKGNEFDTPNETKHGQAYPMSTHTSKGGSHIAIPMTISKGNDEYDNIKAMSMTTGR